MTYDDDTMDDLIEERQGLIVDLVAWRDEQHRAETKRIERASADGVDRPARSMVDRIAAAERELAEFDATHPEVKIEADRRRASRTERYLMGD
jgi:hypothetical protein